MESIVWITIYILGFVDLDAAIRRWNLSHPYYLVHCVHNAAIVWLTWHDVIASFTDFENIQAYQTNMHAVQLCFALHIYHVLCYWQTFRIDDWLHHILMIGVALPLGVILPSGTLLGFSLFFTTGLPGGIDYGLLFAVRNGWLERETEKRVNKFLNTWIRSPGCMFQVALNIAFMFTVADRSPMWYLGFIPAVLNYWNGQYFMAQVVAQVV